MRLILIILILSRGLVLHARRRQSIAIFAADGPDVWLRTIVESAGALRGVRRRRPETIFAADGPVTWLRSSMPNPYMSAIFRVGGKFLKVWANFCVYVFQGKYVVSKYVVNSVPPLNPCIKYGPIHQGGGSGLHSTTKMLRPSLGVKPVATGRDQSRPVATRILGGPRPNQTV